jgi:hypothetical protein
MVHAGALKLQVSLGTNHKKVQTLMKSVKSLEIEAASIHDYIGSGFRNEDTHHVDIVHFPIRYIDKDRNDTLDIYHRMELDSAFDAPEPSLRKQRQTKVDCRRIQRLNGCIEIESKVCV